ncbi:MAG: class I SAM-dependent methyltransferase [Pseudomonadota bacterium]
MIVELQHDLRLQRKQDETSRQEFVSSLRSYVLNDMAASMRNRYEADVKPSIVRKTGEEPVDGPAVHKAMKDDLYFKFYSAVRYNAQEMVWRSIIPSIERNLDSLIEKADALNEDDAVPGSLTVTPDFEVPKNVSAIDVHLAPGSYSTEFTANDVATGSIYDNGLAVFSFGQMGANLDDIGMSMANYVRLKFPDFHPEKILDCGCAIGHNTVPWAKTFPDAEVYGVDVAAPAIRYGAARAQSQGAPVHFMQMDAKSLDFEDETFDVVFSSMFLHELPLKDIHAFFREARRVLKPGGLFLNMELPPNSAMSAYDSFYLDWDCYYNKEPYYKKFRDQNFSELLTGSGFDDEAKHVEFIVPRYTYTDESEFNDLIQSHGEFGESTGRLANFVKWFGFGSWK